METGKISEFNRWFGWAYVAIFLFNLVMVFTNLFFFFITGDGFSLLAAILSGWAASFMYLVSKHFNRRKRGN